MTGVLTPELEAEARALAGPLAELAGRPLEDVAAELLGTLERIVRGWKGRPVDRARLRRLVGPIRLEDLTEGARIALARAHPRVALDTGEVGTLVFWDRARGLVSIQFEGAGRVYRRFPQGAVAAVLEVPDEEPSPP